LPKVVEVDKVKDLNKFLEALKASGFTVELGPHVVLEDHSELTSIKVLKNGELAAYIVAHYITQYYRAVINGSYESDEKFLDRLYEIKYSSERWSIPVNPLYAVVFNEEIIEIFDKYEDQYPVEDGERVVNEYRARNPNYKNIPRVLIARFLD
jgi:hypothetical protein